MKIAICDDNIILHEYLKGFLEEYSACRSIDLVYDDFTSGADLIAASGNNYDMIFMDYQMNGLDGLETSRRLRQKNVKSAIIFLTSYVHVVFETFEVDAYRFLTKPIDRERLFSAMDDFLRSGKESSCIVIKTEDGIRRIDTPDIVYAEAAGKYCYIRTTDDNILFRATLADLEKMLPEDQFFRTHRSYLASLRHISSYNPAEIVFDNKERALISKLRLSAFKEAFLAYVRRNNSPRPRI